MYSRVLIVVLCVVALGFGSLAYRWINAEEPAVDARLSEVSFNDLTGTPQNFSQWAGKLLVVNFWATWCPPCKQEMPEFVRAQQEWGARGVQFIGIAIDDPKEVQTYLSVSPVNYPILIGEPGGPEWAAELGDALQVLPFTAVIDRAGRVVRVKSGPYSRDELMELLSGLAAKADDGRSG
jgi:thiol-disulfide isomerase/thioredoxin